MAGLWHNFVTGGKNKNMKASRLLAYGAMGIIAGLLVENRALLTREQVKEKGRKLKDKIEDDIQKVKEKVKG